MSPSDPIETLLLLALPASGKSEVRRYIASLDPQRCRRDLFLRPTVQLDDFPYVHLMRRCDEELGRHSEPTVFFRGADRPFRDGRDWGTLIALVNEDWADLVAHRVHAPASAAAWICERLDHARTAVDAPPFFEGLGPRAREALLLALEPDARALVASKTATATARLDDRTIVIEFARGGPDGASMPLAAPLGYAWSLAQLAPQILERAAILYVWVTPEESRKKNAARANPDDPGSILHHGVPLEVMLSDYGCDDIGWLVESSDQPGTVRVDAHGRVFHLPIARFDNRVDKTSFVRDDPSRWKPEAVRALHEGLAAALGELARAPGRSPR